jgi:tetratricopeptide (TPR) repeat protein
MFTLMLALWLQTASLGTVHFENSGSAPAQTAFTQGVAAMHNFFYEEAEKYFQEAQKIDPNFAMAYWGEALTHNHPLWSQQDIAAGRKALAKFAAGRSERLNKTPTEREKMFMEAAEVLYGEGDKLSRDIAYMKVMERLYEKYPRDMEVASFYALSLLGTVRPGERGFRRQMKSAAILEDIFKRNPNHPGAAHYLIHSYDDPEHAPLGLPAARRYADIAAAAHHARHMPSHIFVQLGMWEDVARSNESSFKASDEWVKREKLPISRRDYHSLAWLQYAYLQLGNYDRAKELIGVMRDSAREAGEAGLSRTAASMTARYVIETGQWNEMVPAESAGASIQAVAGIAAAKLKDFAKAESLAASLKKTREGHEANGRSYEAKPVAIMEKEVLAVIAMEQGRQDEALRLAKEATEIEMTLDPPSGPPEPMKPSFELYGELLLQAGKPKEAAAQFAEVLLRMPNRALSVKGSVRATD